jgi:hypothetical protein
MAGRMQGLSKVFRELSEKFGMSADEILETATKKASSTGDEVSEAATIANLKKEAADASQPIGSGKNLDALQRARVSAKDLDEVNAYPKNIQQDELANAGDFKLVGEPQTTDFTMVPEGSQVPAIRTNTMPEVIPGSAAPSNLPSIVANQTDAAIPAIYRNIDKSTISKMDPRLKGVAAALGLGGLGYGMMGGDEEQPQIPMAPQAKQEVPPAQPQVITPVQRAASSAIAAPKSDSLDFKALENTFDKGMAGLPQESTPEEQEPDYSSLMREAQQSSNQNDFYNHLLRAGNQAGSAIASLGAGSQVKADYSGVDALEKTAGKPVSDIKGLMETKSSEQKLKAAQEDLKDDAKMRDPNSEVSKLTAELAAKAGLIKPGQVMSAQALKNSGVNIGNLLSTIEAGKARKESAALQREAMSASKGETNKLKIQGSVDRQVSQLLKSKDYEAYNAAKDAKSALDFALESGDKTASGSAFMQFAKIAQGDNSVVRDGDMAILAGGYNYTSPAQMITKLAAKAAGGNFNDDELKQMKAVANKVQEIKGRRVQQLMSPVIERAGAAGLNLEESLDPSMIGEFSGKSQGLTTGIVKVRRIKDGLTKDMPASSAANIDKTKYEIVK